METYDIIEIIIYAVILICVVAFQDYRLKKVEKRLDEHNHYAKLFNDTNKDIEIMKNDIKNLNWYSEEQYKSLIKINEKIDKIKGE